MEEINKKHLVVLIILTAALTVYTYSLRFGEPEPAPMPDLGSIPGRIGGYRAQSFSISPEASRVLGADTTISRIYSGRGSDLEFFLGFFRRQQKNSQIHSPKHCYPGSGWDIIRENRLELESSGEVIPARSLLISDGHEKRMVIYWFNIKGRMVTGEFALKFEQMKSSLLGRPQGAAFIRFSAVLPPGKENKVRGKLVNFAEMSYPYIERALQIERDGSS